MSDINEKVMQNDELTEISGGSDISDRRRYIVVDAGNKRMVAGPFKNLRNARDKMAQLQVQHPRNKYEVKSYM